jgi:hypothetical protein
MTELAGHDRQSDQRKQDEAATSTDHSEFVCHREHLPPLKAEILERLGSAAEEHRRTAFVATFRRQVALRDPRRSAMRGRRQLGKGIFRRSEGGVGFV